MTGVISIAIIISTILYVGLGTIMGLLTKSIVEASVSILPVMLLFMGAPFLMSLSEKYPILSIVEYMPHPQLVEIATTTGAGFSDVLPNLLILLLWAVVIHIIVVFLYNKRMKD